MKLRVIIIYATVILGFGLTTVLQAQTPTPPVAIVLPAGASVSVSCASDTLTVETTSATSRRISCASVAATGTPVPTVVLPTVTPTPTMPMPDAMISGWHAPGKGPNEEEGINVHSHFDAPQTWVTAWSMENFGHGVIYGGDENSGPAEMAMKIQAYKGIRATSDAGGQVYLRYHAGSNPLDRSSRYHSYEVYYRDTSGNVSFWQGWYDTGDPNTLARCPRRSPTLPCENDRPIILVVDRAAWDAGIRGEQWYMFSSPQSGVSWDMGITILNATTFYNVGENATAADESTWQPTGDKGMRIRSDGFWYLGRNGGGTDLVGWFCAEALGRITSRGSKTCAAGSLPQYIAPTIGNDARSDGFGNNRVQWLTESTRPSGGQTITLPN